MSIRTFSFPTPIHFGPGARLLVKEHLLSRGLTRPLIVTDRALSDLPIFKDFQKQLRIGGQLEVGTFSEISGNPVKTQVQEGVKSFQAHHADCIVGFGGGAALDVAKAIALMAHHPGDLFDYEDEKPGARKIDQPIPAWIALPTTSGTGSEVGRSSVISDDQTHLKKIIFSPALLAQAVFADPELTYDLPAPLTAATGMDALTHCVEAYLAQGFHPLCDGIALEGLRLASQSLRESVENPTNLEARSAMMMASLMGAVAFQKGLGLTHSCAHALSTVYDLHHGLANGIMIDHALAFNLPAVPERFKRMAQTVGLTSDSPEAFLLWLEKLKRDLAIPASLRQLALAEQKRATQTSGTPASSSSAHGLLLTSVLGSSENTLTAARRLSELAFLDGCHQNNPRRCTEADFLNLFKKAFEA